MVRLVFRPYTQIRRTICTSVSLRASTRVSPGFTLFRHRSPSFGSQHICSYSNLPQANDRSIVPPTRGRDSYLALSALLSLRIRLCQPNTRIYVRLLGPCFKTGGRKPFRPQRETSNWCSKVVFTLRTSRTLFSYALRQTDPGHRPFRGGLSLLMQDHRRTQRLNLPEGKHQPKHFLRRSYMLWTLLDAK